MNKKNMILIVVILVLLYLCGITYLELKNDNNEKNANEIPINNEKNPKKLTLKSTTETNKKIEYVFEENILKKVYIFEKFENEEEFEKKLGFYKELGTIKIVDVNYSDYCITTQREKLGEDENLSYEEIYDKYLVQIIGAYEVVD